VAGVDRRLRRRERRATAQLPPTRRTLIPVRRSHHLFRLSRSPASQRGAPRCWFDRNGQITRAWRIGAYSCCVWRFASLACLAYKRGATPSHHYQSRRKHTGGQVPYADSLLFTFILLLCWLPPALHFIYFGLVEVCLFVCLFVVCLDSFVGSQSPLLSASPLSSQVCL